MKITRENIDNGNAIIKVLIEKNDYEKNVADKLKDYRLKAALPGFRPGKVPASLINKRFAKPVLAEEVNALLSNNLTNYLYDEKIAILGDPLPNNELQKSIDWDADTDFEFVFDIALSPEVTVDLENSISFKYYNITVDEDMIDQSVDNVRQRFGTNTETETVSDNSSVRGDFIQLAENGEKLEGGIEANGVLIAVDLIKDEEVKNSIVGKTKGETLTFDPVKTFGDRHEVGHMLNISHEVADELNSLFSFTIQSILQFTKADVNEELYKNVYGEEAAIATEEEFRSRISEEIAKNLSWSSNQKFAVDARDTLVENTRFDLPEAFLKRWLKEVNREMTEEQVENEFEGFTKDLRWQLIKNHLIKENNLTVSDDEISALAREIALSQFQQYGIYDLPEEHLSNYVKKILEKEEDKERIVRRIFEDKVIRVVREKGNIIEEEISAEAFRNMDNSEAEENA